MRPRKFRFDDSALSLEARVELARWRGEVDTVVIPDEGGGRIVHVYSDYAADRAAGYVIQ